MLPSRPRRSWAVLAFRDRLTAAARWRQGDDAAGQRAVEAVYGELRRLAAHYFRQERAGHTLQPTAVVHELYLKFFEGDPVEWKDRGHFFAVASRQIRRILIDHARRRGARKRSRTWIAVPEFGSASSDRFPKEDLMAVDQAVEALEEIDPRAAKVVELRVFAGLQEAEIASALAVSMSTVKRDWRFARAWLIHRLQGGR